MGTTTPPLVLCFGEALVDRLLPPGETMPAADARGWEDRLGGAPANGACALARLGTPAAFLGRLGTDAIGEAFAALFTARGVDSRALQWDPERPSRLVLGFETACDQAAISLQKGPVIAVLIKQIKGVADHHVVAGVSPQGRPCLQDFQSPFAALPAPGDLLHRGRHDRQHEQMVELQHQGIGFQGQGLPMPVNGLVDEIKVAEEVPQFRAAKQIGGLKLGGPDQTRQRIAVTPHPRQQLPELVPAGTVVWFQPHGLLQVPDRGRFGAGNVFSRRIGGQQPIGVVRLPWRGQSAMSMRAPLRLPPKRS